MWSKSVQVHGAACVYFGDSYLYTYLPELPDENAFPRCLWVVNLGELLVFLISVAVVFSRSCSIWGGGGADTFVSSCPTHTDWSIYLPSGAENAVSVNDAIFVPAGWEPVSFNTWNGSQLWEGHIVTPNVEGDGRDFDIVDGR